MTYFSEKNSVHSITKFIISSELTPIDLQYLTIIQKYIKKEKILDIGGFAIGLHLKKNRWNKLECCLLSGLPFFDLITPDMDSTLQQLKRILPPFQIQTEKNSHLYEILPKRYNLFFLLPDGTQKIFCRIIDGSDGCYSYTVICGYTIGTIDTILFHLYGNLLSYLFFNIHHQGISMSSHTLRLIHLLELKNSRFTLKERFKLRCIGTEKTKEDYLRLNWEKKRLFHFRP